MNKDLEAVQDAAWLLKDLCDDLAPRKLSAGDLATLQSVKRDLGRLENKLVGIRDKRKRGGAEDHDEPTEQAAAPTPLFSQPNGGSHAAD